VITNTDTGQIRQLIAGLRRGDPLREVAESILNGQPQYPDARDILLDQLRSPSVLNWKRPAVAAWSLGCLEQSTEEAQYSAQRLIALLEDRPGRSVGCFLASGCFFAYLGFLYIGYASIVDGAINRVRAIIATSLGNLGVAESAEALANALMEMPGRAASGDRQVRAMSAWALYRVLLKHPDKGYGQLPLQTVPALCKILVTQKETVVLPALEVLKLIGGSSAIPSVERVEKKSPSMRARAEATRVLEILRGRQAQERAHQRLLRPAGIPAGGDAALLRPAVHTHEGEVELLLRPADLEGDSGSN
jgi:hypothetical protein